MLNVTATETIAAGYLTVYPCGSPRPNPSNVNYEPGQSILNAVIAKLDASGTVCIYTYADTHVAIDVNGYYPA